MHCKYWQANSLTGTSCAMRVKEHTRTPFGQWCNLCTAVYRLHDRNNFDHLFSHDTPPPLPFPWARNSRQNVNINEKIWEQRACGPNPLSRSPFFRFRSCQMNNLSTCLSTKEESELILNGVRLFDTIWCNILMNWPRMRQKSDEHSNLKFRRLVCLRAERLNARTREAKASNQPIVLSPM